MSKVLIVEDDMMLASEMTRTLRRAGHAVQAAGHAGAGMAAINDFEPDVLILDVILPVYSGFNLLHELQSYADTAKLPVIICSSNASELSLRDLGDYGVKRLLDKATMRPDDLVAAVKAVS